ncbi:unnamed protein product [Colias eurytheme]|nr:unnamed protein product [Colias eurytheme]
MNNSLEKVWLAGHQQFANEPEDHNVHYLSVTVQILDMLYERRSSRRASLGTASILVSGVARLYKKEIEQLFKDCRKLDQSIVMKDKKTKRRFILRYKH